MTVKGRKRPSRTRAEWIEEIRRWRKSGQTAAEYGAEHDVHPGTLVFWGSKLRDVVPIAVRRPQRRPVAKFVPVRVSSAAPAASSASGDLEVILRNGRRVRVSDDFDPALLARVLETAEGGTIC